MGYGHVFLRQLAVSMSPVPPVYNCLFLQISPALLLCLLFFPSRNSYLGYHLEMRPKDTLPYQRNLFPARSMSLQARHLVRPALLVSGDASADAKCLLPFEFDNRAGDLLFDLFPLLGMINTKKDFWAARTRLHGVPLSPLRA